MTVKRVLWIVNTPFRGVAEHLGLPTSPSGTWFVSLLKSFQEIPGIEAAVATVSGSKFQDVTFDGVRYFFLPGSGKTMLLYHDGLKSYWDRIESLFQPDIVHVFGTEYSHSLSYLRYHPNKKVIVTTQGLIGKIVSVRNGGLTTWESIRYRSFQELLKFNGMFEQTILMKNNVKYEREIIERANYVLGRTDSDEFYVQSINPKAQYFRHYFSLSPEFYEAPKWNVDEAEPTTIFGGACFRTPFKGGHILLRALSVAKRFIPNITLKAIHPSTNGRLKIRNGYDRYLARLIRKYDLYDNLELKPRLSSAQVIQEMRSSRLCVVPSAMENGSTTLREAMCLGMPCVAAFRGGMTDLIEDGESGFFYDYQDFDFLAGRIVQLMTDDQLALKLARNAPEYVAYCHDREKNRQDLLKIYDVIMNE